MPGGAAAGTVLAVGEGVDPAWTGRRVVAGPGALGTYAEQVAVPLDRLIPVPDGLGLREAAALAHDGVTGTGIAEAAGIRPGERVLILGASGGMGTLLVQMARAAGARVVGAARGERKLGLVRELGADAVVDYSEEGWTDRAREALGGAGADVLLDGVGGELGLAGFALTADGGRVSAHGEVQRRLRGRRRGRGGTPGDHAARDQRGPVRDGRHHAAVGAGPGAGGGRPPAPGDRGHVPTGPGRGGARGDRGAGGGGQGAAHEPERVRHGKSR